LHQRSYSLDKKRDIRETGRGTRG